MRKTVRKGKKLLSFFLLLAGSVLLSGCSIFKEGSPEPYQVELEVWGVFDDTDAYTEVLSEYQRINPYVRSINYRKMPIETYKEDLVNALASGKGPDIFMIRNSWRSAFEDKIVPVPENMITEQEFRNTFVDVAASDSLGADGQIYAAPLSVDSLALYYNKDLLNAAGIARPPATWEELLQNVRALTRIDQFGNINQSAAALGTAYNINRSTDILSTLMLQYGASLAPDTSGRRNLDSQEHIRALEFYTQFARSNSAFYTWNPRLHYSIDSFYEGNLAMMLNYSWQYPTIVQKNAKLNIGIAPLPQFAGSAPANQANYWSFAVAKNKEYVPPIGEEDVPVDTARQDYLRIHESWQLLKFLALGAPDKTVTLMNGLSGTTKEFTLAFDPTEKYLEVTKKPAARRDLIEKQKADVILGPFATGNLIATNWYQGNPEAMETIFAEMIDTMNRGGQSVYDILSTAANRLNLVR